MLRSIVPIFAFSFLLFLMLGCGDQRYSEAVYDSTKGFDNSVASSESVPARQGKSHGGMGSGKVPEGDEDLVGRPEEGEAGEGIVSQKAQHNRRVIFDSDAHLRVEDFDGMESKISALVERHGGYISNAQISNQISENRSGDWTIRVPVTAYRQLVDSVGNLGELISRNEKATDVTAEFYDLEARIKNKKLLEDRIAALLDQAKSELRRMIEVEHELARVREEIERMEGRIRYLSDVTGMSTIRLKVRELERPPAPMVASSFSNRISNAWQSASQQAIRTGENVAVGLVRNVFNIGFALALVAIAWIVGRVVVRRMGRRTAVVAETVG